MRQGTLACLWCLSMAVLPCLGAWAAPVPEPGAALGASVAQDRPGAYWWWMGSAVDKDNLSRQLAAYDCAGMGGVHIIPIYGAKGYEDRYIPYLSPQWMEMLAWTTAEAAARGMWVDMTTGTGWCFGGPNIDDDMACAVVRRRTKRLKPGKAVDIALGADTIQAAVAFGKNGETIELTDRITADGRLAWEVPAGEWRLFWVWQKPAGRMVKRTAPGGEGPMLNPFYGAAMAHYVERFDAAFADYAGTMPRAMYHDSYEYQGDWSPDLLAEFEVRRGYRLQRHFAAFFGEGAPDEVARLKCDYRETLSDMMVENTIGAWAAWARGKGCITRNQAHGSPGNLLDLYAVADIPETEMFRLDRDPLIAKFASSAAHVLGKPRVAAETGTWLQEHFTTTLADVKDLVDELFIAGVNQVVYHGTCYSPEDAPWPGWLFYASTEMNPRNAIWRHAGALNQYIERQQRFLQCQESANDILLYWPIHDLWHDPEGTVQTLTVHHTEWFTEQPIGTTARRLWERGYTFDYTSDRMLAQAKALRGGVQTPGASYKTVLVPPCTRMPMPTMQRLIELAEDGATILFEGTLPRDVPGLHELESRRRQLVALVDGLSWSTDGGEALTGKGRILVGRDTEALLGKAGVLREAMADHGLCFIRKKGEDGHKYFVANRSCDRVDGWIPLGTAAKGVLIAPREGDGGSALPVRAGAGHSEVYLELEVGESCLLSTTAAPAGLPENPLFKAVGGAIIITGTWQVAFVSGGPVLPEAFETQALRSWTELGGTETARFAGAARYTITFDAPKMEVERWRLELGRVAESAHVWLNGVDYGIKIAPPFNVLLDPDSLAASGNILEVEVVNLSANRIRDLDRRGVAWRNFHDINFVNVDYKPFDASEWPIRASGLLGPACLREMRRREF